MAFEAIGGTHRKFKLLHRVSGSGAPFLDLVALFVAADSFSSKLIKIER
jgi:hypothetical protein